MKDTKLSKSFGEENKSVVTHKYMRNSQSASAAPSRPQATQRHVKNQALSFVTTLKRNEDLKHMRFDSNEQLEDQPEAGEDGRHIEIQNSNMVEQLIDPYADLNIGQQKSTLYPTKSNHSLMD